MTLVRLDGYCRNRSMGIMPCVMLAWKEIICILESFFFFSLIVLSVILYFILIFSYLLIKFLVYVVSKQSSFKPLATQPLNMCTVDH